MKLRDIRLSTRITVAALATVAVGGLLLILAEESRLHKVYLNEQRNQMEQSLQAEKQRLTMAVDKLRRDTLFLSNTPPVSGIVRARNNGGIDPREGNTRAVWEKRLQEIFSAFASTNPDYYRIRYIGVADDGRELVRVDMRDGVARIIPQTELESVSSADYFKATTLMSAGQAYLSEFDLHHESAAAAQPVRPSLRAAVPVFATDGRLFGMVVINMDVGQLLSLASRGLPDSARAYITNVNGSYLLYPGAGKSSGFEVGRNESILADLPTLARLADRGAPDHLPLQRFETDKEKYYLAAERVHFDFANPEHFLILAYKIPASALEAGITSIATHFILVSLLAMLLVGGMVLLVLRRTFAPLEQIAEMAGKIADGDYVFDTPEHSGGEIGQLAHAMDVMLHRLVQREQDVLKLNAELGEKVEQRTGELQTANARLNEEIAVRRQAEEAMRIAAAAFETRDAILITDADSNIIRVNHAFTEITGYQPEDALGQNPRILSSGKQDHAFFVEMRKELQRNGVWSGEIWNKRKNGEIYASWMNITAIKNELQEITRYVAIFRDITESKQAEEEIRTLAFYDTLTRLPNRRLFLERLRAALPASVRRRDFGAVMFLDMDRFKTLNDTLGHDYGDLMLIEVAQRIKNCVREMDTVARLGGDEFVVLIEGVSSDEQLASHKIGAIAEKVREALAQPYQLKQHEYLSSPSIGITLYHGNEESVEVLLRRADLAMYQVKNEGRNAVRFFDPVMQDNVERHDALKADLHHAAERGELHLYYQIQVDSEQRPIGAEALLRWQHPLRGLVMPDQFIPVAEESMLILGIGRWVLDEACAQLALWHDNDRLRDLTLTVNISARQFVEADFVAQVAAIVKQHRIEPARLKLELTSSIISDNLDETVEKMLALRSLGINLAMNGFDNVYSSLHSLKKLSSERFKIHHQIVQEMTADSSDAQLVQAIVDLANHMEMDVFAEGVETDAQLAFFKQRACKAYQGFLFSRPVPIEAFEALLAKQAYDLNR